MTFIGIRFPVVLFSMKKMTHDSKAPTARYEFSTNTTQSYKTNMLDLENNFKN